MRKYYPIFFAILFLCSHQFSIAQCNGLKGPNLLGARGTFSKPLIKVNVSASACSSSGANTYSPVGNVGTALAGCTNPGTGIPCSDYNYTASYALPIEDYYSLLNTVGDMNGGNCIKPDWRGKEHTGDGGYFMAVNGAPNSTYSPVFYQVKSIPVCAGYTYEFSAWVINLLPGSSPSASPGTEPNISFKINGQVISNSGPIAYTSTPTWIKVSGSFVATTDTVDLQVINATAAASGNDLGLDDISLNVCGSQIEVVRNDAAYCTGAVASCNFIVTDNLQANAWYKWQVSKDGGIVFNDSTSGAQAVFTGNSYTLTNNLGIVDSSMNGYKYRLVVAASLAGLSNPDCIYFNDYTLNVASCRVPPVPCNGLKGPNLLGARGTFSKPFIKINATADYCIRSGANSYSPVDNVGNALTGCTNPGTGMPCSNYNYTASYALPMEDYYSILNIIGDLNGGNCIKPDWRGSEHTGDGGYFMAVNGAPNSTYSPVFYQIKSIPVCRGYTYEFSAWVINLLPVSSSSANPGSEPNISFNVNGEVISNSGPIAYTSTPTWVKVTGTFVATTDTVDLQVINATAVASGNDLGLDDISFNVCGSQIEVIGDSTPYCAGAVASSKFIVTDNLQSNTWYKWQVSKDGGIIFNDSTFGAQAAFTGNSYTLINNMGVVNSAMNGYRYRLAVANSLAGLSNPDCISFNDYTLNVASCMVLPAQLTFFNGRYVSGKAALNWKTSQENNSSNFEIYRGTNGINFTRIGMVNSAGNSNTIKNYDYEDDLSDVAGTYVYYRLKQVAADGKSIFSSIVRLSHGTTPALEIFPNPFKNNFTLSLNVPKASTALIRILNSSGTTVYAKTINLIRGDNSIILNNLPDLKPGFYYVSVLNEEFNLKGKLQKL